MVVDTSGRAYVGNFGFDLHGDASLVPAELVCVHPDGRVEVAARQLAFPNGTVITPDGRTLIVGESFGGRLTAFDIDAAGKLTNRRTWASCPSGSVPDGICLDAQGAIWIASPTTNECLRILEGGATAGRIATAHGAFACMLGGADRRTLFIATASTSDPDQARRERGGRIESVRVDVPGAGLP